MARQVSLKDLAKMLGVAPSTVSRALKGHPDISKATCETVRKLAEKLHYTPNQLALSLRKQKSNLIAVIVPVVVDYFFSNVICGILNIAYAAGYRVLIFDSHEEYEREVEICRSVKKSGIEGILVSTAKTTWDTTHFQELKDMGVALVFFDRICGDVDTDRVIVDDFGGAYTAVSHMISMGCRKIAHFAAGQHIQMAQKRQMGYVQALIDNRIPVDRQLIVPCEGREEAGEAIEKMMNEQEEVDGVFTVNDLTGVGVLEKLKKMGYDVPTQVAVCGFGNDQVSSVITPGLTTVDQDGEQMGELAAELLLKRIQAETRYDTTVRMLKAGLVIRNSTCIFSDKK